MKPLPAAAVGLILMWVNNFCTLILKLYPSHTFINQGAGKCDRRFLLLPELTAYSKRS
jgi:hypothetical protein